MSGVGNCYDNAVAESFFSGFKNELGDTFPSRRQGRSDAFVFIETYYNPYRRHSFNGNISPLDCEAFFARNGRRPTGVKDLIRRGRWLLDNTNSQGSGRRPEYRRQDHHRPPRFEFSAGGCSPHLFNLSTQSGEA
jgi:hypothetical protein